MRIINHSPVHVPSYGMAVTPTVQDRNLEASLHKGPCPIINIEILATSILGYGDHGSMAAMIGDQQYVLPLTAVEYIMFLHS
jgi:hypothetical protein